MVSTRQNKRLDKYRKFCGQEVINQLYTKAQNLKGKHIVFISSTYQGGGVAEMLNSIIFLFNELGVEVGWRILHGDRDFFTVTKKFHDALQGGKINLSQRKKNLYYETNERFAIFTHLNHDLVVVHDPQPLPLIDFYKKKQPWFFRCHVDLSEPNPAVWSYLKNFIEKYDRMIISKEDYQHDIKIPHTIIYPAIDPLSLKNRTLAEKTIKKYLKRYEIPISKPIIAQISRFDKWKDPLGVIKIFEKVRKKIDCSLVLLGSLATDDPNGAMIYEKVVKVAARSKFNKDIKVLLVQSDILVNCLQRKAAVVIQKSKREGFGLVVAEALYKGTPVVASKVGGIPLQVIDGLNGYLLNPEDLNGFVKKTILILQDQALRTKLSANASNHIRSNFLITRSLADWLSLFEQCLFTPNNK